MPEREIVNFNSELARVDGHLESVRERLTTVGTRLYERRVKSRNLSGRQRIAATLQTGMVAEEVSRRLRERAVTLETERADIEEKFRQTTQELEEIRTLVSAGVLPESALQENEEEYRKLTEPIAPEKEEDELIDPKQLLDYPSMDAFLGRATDQAASLIRDFISSPHAAEITSRLRRLYVQNNREPSAVKRNVQDTAFKPRLVGALFEGLGYQYLTRKYASDPDIFVLSPQEVLELYKSNFPERVKDYGDAFNNVRVEGISHPDYIILRQMESDKGLIVDTIVECKSSANTRTVSREAIERQRRNYSYPQFANDFFRRGKGGRLERAKILHGLRPDIPIKPISINPDFSLVYIMPQNSTIQLDEQVQIEKMPIDSRAFSEFVDVFMSAVRDYGTDNQTKTLDTQKEQPAQNADVGQADEDAQAIEDLAALKKIVTGYFAQLDGSAQSVAAGRIGKTLAATHFAGITAQDITLAEARGLIKPQRVRGSVRLTHKELVIVAYFLRDAKSTITGAKADALKLAVQEAWDAHRQTKRAELESSKSRQQEPVMS